jgi:hypothetical protein
MFLPQNFRPLRSWIRFLSAFVLIAGVSSCFRDDGIIDPNHPDSAPLLGRFSGRAFRPDPSAFDKILDIQNPKIALVWQFIGPKEFTFSTSEAVVSPLYPFSFRVDLRNPPPKDVLESQDLAVGTFWLYSDVDSNGVLDRLVHPEMLSMNLHVDEMYATYTTAMDSLIAVSEVVPEGRDTVETYYLGKFGTVVRMVDGVPDTLFTGKGPLDLKEEYWFAVVSRRLEILNNTNRWERFFILRKRDNKYFRIERPAEGFATSYDFQYRRRLYPRPGGEKEFERRVRDASQKWIDFTSQYVLMYRDALAHGWQDYPYTGHKEPGQDWVMGRTRNHCVLYIRNKAAMDEMIEAERYSSFSVTGKEKLHLGYNLIRCGDQYECEVLDAGAEISVDLGSTEEFFNPRSTPLIYPLAEPKEAQLPHALVERLQGAYRFLPFLPFCLVADKGALWASIPGTGILRMVPADSANWFAPGTDLQMEIVQNGGKPEKLLLYTGGKRYVATAEPTLSIPDAIMAGIRAAMDRRAVSVSAGKLAGFAGAYDYGGDTLRISAAPDGDSLLVSVPRMKPHHYLASSESVFFSPQCDCRLRFTAPAGAPPGGDSGRAEPEFTKDGVSVRVPRFGQASPDPSRLFPELKTDPDSAVSSSEGSMRDTYLGLDGKGRYAAVVPGAAGGDGLYLAAGDGWVVSLDHSLPGDSISLGKGGEGIVWRVPGLPGAAGLEVKMRRGAASKGRARFRLLGGTDRSRPDRLLAGDFWVDFAADTAGIRLAPWPVAADPYYVRLERVATADAAFPVAFESYRLLTARPADSAAMTASAPEPHAHP